MGDLREQVREALLDSYRHREPGEHRCAICGRTGVPLAFHVLEGMFREGEALPESFVPMSASRGFVRGSYPVCASCAPECRKCHLPILTAKVAAWGKREGAARGIGICGHVHLRTLLAVFARWFGAVGM